MAREAAKTERKQRIAQERWQYVQQRLKDRLGTDAFDNWFGRMQMQEVAGSAVVMSVPLPFLRHYVMRNYSAHLLAAWQEELPEVAEVRLVVRGIETKKGLEKQKTLPREQEYGNKGDNLPAPMRGNFAQRPSPRLLPAPAEAEPGEDLADTALAERIRQTVSARFDISLSLLTVKGRATARPRYIGTYLTRVHTKLTAAQVAALYGIGTIGEVEQITKSVEQFIENGLELKATVRAIEKELGV